MVAEPWTQKMGNQMSSNLKKHACVLENSPNKKQGSQDRCIIGILSFEVANAMSKIIHLHKSLADNEIIKLKNEILNSEGIKTLVSSDEKQLLQLALEEKLDDLNKIADVVSRLGKKCTIPILQGFEHVYGDIVSGMVDIKELSFLVKDMESMVRKMERYVNLTVRLYDEIEVMNELEVATKKFQQNQHEESRKAFEQKLMWQKEDVRHLKDVSLWNRTYDKVVELLARTVCTIYARICIVFADAYSRGDIPNDLCFRSQICCNGNLQHVKWESQQRDVAGKVQKDGILTKFTSSKNNGYSRLGQIENEEVETRTLSVGPKVGLQKHEGGLFHPQDYTSACFMGRRRLFTDCFCSSTSASQVDDDDDHVRYDDHSSQISGLVSASSSAKIEHPNLSGCFVHAVDRDHPSGNECQTKGSLVNISTCGQKRRLLVRAPPRTLGGSALALHYANVIIVLEKLLRHPQLVGDEARDDLYQMLPTSLRMILKSSLKSYAKDLAIYDAPLAHGWRERLELLLEWLAPLAHDTIRWQSEQNFEQHQILTKKNILLLQTLHFADQEKTEAVICELLVGLNYICRFEQQRNALFDCASSFDFEDYMEWQMQVGSSFKP